MAKPLRKRELTIEPGQSAFHLSPPPDPNKLVGLEGKPKIELRRGTPAAPTPAPKPSGVPADIPALEPLPPGNIRKPDMIPIPAHSKPSPGTSLDKIHKRRQFTDPSTHGSGQVASARPRRASGERYV